MNNQDEQDRRQEDETPPPDHEEFLQSRNSGLKSIKKRLQEMQGDTTDERTEDKPPS